MAQVVGRVQYLHLDESGILAQAQMVQKDCDKYYGMEGYTIRPIVGKDILRLDLTIQDLFGQIRFFDKFQSPSLIKAITILTNSRFTLLGKGINTEASPSMLFQKMAVAVLEKQDEFSLFNLLKDEAIKPYLDKFYNALGSLIYKYDKEAQIALEMGSVSLDRQIRALLTTAGSLDNYSPSDLGNIMSLLQGTAKITRVASSVIGVSSSSSSSSSSFSSSFSSTSTSTSSITNISTPTITTTTSGLNIVDQRVPINTLTIPSTIPTITHAGLSDLNAIRLQALIEGKTKLVKELQAKEMRDLNYRNEVNSELEEARKKKPGLELELRKARSDTESAQKNWEDCDTLYKKDKTNTVNRDKWSDALQSKNQCEQNEMLAEHALTMFEIDILKIEERLEKANSVWEAAKLDTQKASSELSAWNIDLENR